MSSDRSNILQIACVYTGIILGAGFASGQELFHFFVRFGSWGIPGLFVSGFLFILAGWAVLGICHDFKINNFNQLIRLVSGEKWGAIIECLVAVFLLVLFSTMLAAGGATLREAFHVRSVYGVLLVAGISFITFLFDLKGIVDINVILAPIMVIGGIIIGCYTFFFQSVPTFVPFASLWNAFSQNWLVSAVVYASYNVVTAFAVLATLSKLVTSNKVAKWSGVIGGCSMCLLGICISLPLMVHLGAIGGLEIPMLRIAHQYGHILEFFYFFILFSAILTTAVGNGFAFIQWFTEKTKISPLPAKIITLGLGTGMAFFGFSNFVGKVYPLFGIVGIVEVLAILLFRVKYKCLAGFAKKV